MGLPSFDLELPDNAKDIIAARLPEILSLEPSLGIVSKARNVTFRHERTLVDSQIFTELRPIFQDDPEQPPIAGVILHKLRLTFVEDNKSREFFVTMDSEDVETLRQALDRADKKAGSLRSLLNQTPMRVLEMNTDE